MRKQTAIKSLVRVHFTKRNTGMGVVVEDASGIRRIITAAHCVPMPPNGRGAGNTCVGVRVSTFGSHHAPSATAFLVSWEPCADIAVLANSELESPDFEHLEQLLESSIPAPVCLDIASLGEEFRVHVHQHTGKWVNGTGEIPAFFCHAPALFRAQFPKKQSILSGTSGSPAFDDAGRVIALVSTSTELSGSPDGGATLSCLAGALPGWMLNSLSQGR